MDKLLCSVLVTIISRVLLVNFLTCLRNSNFRGIYLVWDAIAIMKLPTFSHSLLKISLD